MTEQYCTQSQVPGFPLERPAQAGTGGLESLNPFRRGCCRSTGSGRTTRGEGAGWGRTTAPRASRYDQYTRQAYRGSERKIQSVRTLSSLIDPVRHGSTRPVHRLVRHCTTPPRGFISLRTKCKLWASDEIAASSTFARRPWPSQDGDSRSVVALGAVVFAASTVSTSTCAKFGGRACIGELHHPLTPPRSSTTHAACSLPCGEWNNTVRRPTECTPVECTRHLLQSGQGTKVRYSRGQSLPYNISTQARGRPYRTTHPSS